MVVLSSTSVGSCGGLRAGVEAAKHNTTRNISLFDPQLV
jgi:hypothetical protein